MSNNQTKIINRQRINSDYNAGYNTNTIRSRANYPVIEGYFPKENYKSLVIKKVNNTLSGLLLCAIVLSAISYYFVVSSEIKLNEYSRATTLLNVENSELQNKLDRLKSFNNVDLTMQKNNLLQRPETVIEATEVDTAAVKSHKTFSSYNMKPKAWSIGY